MKRLSFCVICGRCAYKYQFAPRHFFRTSCPSCGILLWKDRAMRTALYMICGHCNHEYRLVLRRLFRTSCPCCGIPLWKDCVTTIPIKISPHFTQLCFKALSLLCVFMAIFLMGWIFFQGNHLSWTQIAFEANVTVRAVADVLLRIADHSSNFLQWKLWQTKVFFHTFAIRCYLEIAPSLVCWFHTFSEHCIHFFADTIRGYGGRFLENVKLGIRHEISIVSTLIWQMSQTLLR